MSRRKGCLRHYPLVTGKFGWAKRKDLYLCREEYGGILRNYWLGRWQDFVWRDVTETFASDKLHIHRCCKIRLFFLSNVEHDTGGCGILIPEGGIPVC